MTGVFSRLVGQDAVEAELMAAARAARGDSAHSEAGVAGGTGGSTATMTHAWLITGPPGSGRSVAALCFAAALQCTSDGGRAVPDIVPASAWRAENAVALRHSHQLCPQCQIAYVLPEGTERSSHRPPFQ